MKIAYVGLHLEKEILNGGVGNKIKTQMKVWKELGHSTHCFILSTDKITFLNTSIFNFKKVNNGGLNGLIKQEIDRSVSLKKMIEDVKRFKPDIVYLRYGLYAHPLKRLFKIAPTVIEINSNDVDEYKYRGGFYYWMNRVTRSIQFKNVSGLSAVSWELANLRSFKKYKKTTTVIANGVDFEEYEELPPSENPSPRTIFVGTPGYNWHGIDKLKTFAERYPDVIVDIVGYKESDLAYDLPSNIICHGFLPKEDIIHMMRNADAAFGTLALHRKNMEEASPLKVREALAYGLPIIIAYKDTDLEKIEADFILKLPNKENNIVENSELIYTFIKQMHGRRVDRSKIIQELDQKLKEKARIKFFKDLLLTSANHEFDDGKGL